jgi:regulator of replication initiation timing
MDVASQQMELERQIGVMQQEINGMQTAAHTQTLQNQVNTMRGELERLRMAQNGYR